MTAHEQASDAGDLPRWLQQAARQPWRWQLFALLRRLQASQPGAPAIGLARLPRQESVRLGQQPSLAFAPREIAAIAGRGGGLRIDLYGLGMLGPNGALPLHYTELAHACLHAGRDRALVDFLDLFHHRALCLLYRAWAQAQACAGLDDRQREPFTRYVASLAGDSPHQPAGPWPAHARWASAAQRVRPVRTAAGLRAVLEAHWQIPVRIEEFVLQWLRIDPSERSRLGATDRGACLADAACLGERVPDRQGRLRMVFGPLQRASYLQLLPGRGSAFAALQACVRACIGLDHDWELQLLLPASQARAAALGGPDALGCSAWLAGTRGAGLLSLVFDSAAGTR